MLGRDANIVSLRIRLDRVHRHRGVGRDGGSFASVVGMSLLALAIGVPIANGHCRSWSSGGHKFPSRC
jgi:hypothetical protein